MKRLFSNIIYGFLFIGGILVLLIVMDDWRWRVGTVTIIGLLSLAIWLQVSADIEDSKSDTCNST